MQEQPSGGKHLRSGTCTSAAHIAIKQEMMEHARGAEGSKLDAPGTSWYMRGAYVEETEPITVALAAKYEGYHEAQQNILLMTINDDDDQAAMYIEKRAALEVCPDIVRIVRKSTGRPSLRTMAILSCTLQRCSARTRSDFCAVICMSRTCGVGCLTVAPTTREQFACTRASVSQALQHPYASCLAESCARLRPHLLLLQQPRQVWPQGQQAACDRC